MMTHLDTLKATVQRLHGCTATHAESVPVKEVFHGQTVWGGIVEVFHLEGHPKADKVYAWLHYMGDPESPPRHVTVLHIYPVLSPAAAVRAFIVREFPDDIPAQA
jgi:hypothetical protein